MHKKTEAALAELEAAVKQIVARFVVEEREACAKLVESLQGQACVNIAEEIRKRGQ